MTNSSNRTLSSLVPPKDKNRELATKVMAVKKGLTRAEKIEIYAVLTNSEPPPIKRGRQSEKTRDMKFAYDFFATEDFERLLNKDYRDIKKVAERHKIGTQDLTTVYKALRRGMRALEEHAMRWEAELKKIEEFPELHKRYDHIALFARKALLFVRTFRCAEKTDKRKSNKFKRITKITGIK